MKRTPGWGGSASWLRGLAAALLLTALFGSLLHAAQGEAETSAAALARADRRYAEEHYTIAREIYERLLETGSVPAARRDEVQYRIGVLLGKSRQWDRALAKSLAFVQSHRGTVWEPRGLYGLGQLYLTVPSKGWRVGRRIFRGEGAPETEADPPSEPIGLAEQDARNARDALEAARVLFPAHRAHGQTLDEEIQLDFDLARVLQRDPEFALWAQKQQWAPPTDAGWRVDPDAAYSPQWAPPKKQIYLYAQIERLARSSPSRSRSAALALLGQSIWLQDYHAAMQSWSVKWVRGKEVRLPYPYQSLRPEAPLRRILKEFPADLVRDQAQIILAHYLAGQGRLKPAMAEYRRLLAERPRSAWAADARAARDQIARRELSLALPASQVTQLPASVEVTSRNVRRIRFEVARVRPEDLMASAERLNDPKGGFDTLPSRLQRSSASANSFGPVVARWDEPTGDRGDFSERSRRVRLPITALGAYLVQASAPGLRARTVVLITDLVVVQKLHRDGALFYVTDARGGAPVPNAEVIGKQWWSEYVQLPLSPSRRDPVAPAVRTPTPPKPSARATRTWIRHRSAFARGRTNADGLCALPLPRAEEGRDFRVAALVSRAGKYAYTSRIAPPEDRYDFDTFKGYAITDRAVYRPAQTVHYRQIVLRRVEGEWQPAANEPLRVEVHDPAGKIIHQAEQRANRFGSVSGEFALGTGAPLGEYRLIVWNPGRSYHMSQSGGNRFRVEEYKQPEFVVTVTPTAERVRRGQPTHVRIAARYYFGGPVPRAKITYRVFCTGYAPSYDFPRPFDFLYNARGGADAFYGDGEKVTEGEARTNDQGEARITFPTRPPGPFWDDTDLSYTVEAEVQDASRRVISGSGSVKATRHDVSVFLDFPHGYARRGERLDIAVRTLDPSDAPVSVAGTARVFLKPEQPGGKATPVFAAPMQTDRDGRAVLRWTPRVAGHFRISFVTRDTARQVVSGDVAVWVAGPELARGRFRFQHLFLAAEQPYHEAGQRAKVLFVTPAPGCTVLVTREVSNEIREHRLVRVPGRSLELEVPLDRRDVPNVYVSAVMIHNGQLHQATAELLVPPARQFATVSVQADKERYQPGEKAKLALQARDWQGRPLVAELSVSVTDAALGYIQQAYAPEIRGHFYRERRAARVATAGSPDAGFALDRVDHQPVQHYQGPRWVPLEGMGQLSAWPTSTWRMEYRSPDPYFLPHTGGAVRFVNVFHDVGTRMVPYPFESGVDYFRRPRGVLSYPLDSSLIVRGDPDALSLEQLGQLGALATAAVRGKFADTAFWTPAVVTDETGQATVEVTWPDNLTEWRAAAVGTSATAQVGSGETRVVTKKDLLVRLQAPRFFVERDTVTLSANVHNYLDHAVRARVTLDLGGNAAAEALDLGPRASGLRADDRQPATDDRSTPKAQGLTPKAQGPTPNASETWINLPAGAERRVDWSVPIARSGELRVRMAAQTETAADAMERTFPVIVHGVERQTAQGGVLRQEQRAQVTVTLPDERKPGSSTLIVQLNPSLGAVMLDALPYLADYPYGCIEQTTSRFLPSVVVAKTLKDLGYDLEALGKRQEALGVGPWALGVGGDDQRPATGDGLMPNAQGPTPNAPSPYTYPLGRPGTVAIAELAQAAGRGREPVFDSARLQGMVEEGLARIASFQHGDGGWGWWSEDRSDSYMTSYVLYGLVTARNAGYAVDAGMLDRGLAFLRGCLQKEDDLPRLAYAARVLAMEPGQREAVRPLATGRLFENRGRLSAYSKALLALALHNLDEHDKANVVLRNIETTASVDDINGTAHWDGSEREWWRWHHNKVETNAAVLQAYMAIRPQASLAPMVMKWLVNNRRGRIWRSTRETAMAVYALADYVRVNKELASDYTLTVDLGGRIQRRYTVTRQNALFFDNAFVVPDALLETGAQTLTITKDGPGTLYYTAYTRYFSREEPIPAAGNEIAVQRRYFRLLPSTASGAPAPEPLDPRRPNPFLTGRYELLDTGGVELAAEETAGGPHYRRAALRSGETVTSGDLLEVELQLTAKNDYDYLVFEDLKPAGCEPVDLRSGMHGGGDLYANMELRDEKVAFFLTTLPQGTRTLRYRLRAEIPGAFHVLPTNGYAMYAPDIRALSDEMRLAVRDED